MKSRQESILYHVTVTSKLRKEYLQKVKIFQRLDIKMQIIKLFF